MRCDKCGKEAVLFQKYSGQHLCQQHFVVDMETKAKRAIRTHRWLSPDDHIAVGLSGDAATSALLFFLKKLTAQRRDIRISAIAVDEGIAGFRDPMQAERIAASLEVTCIRGSFEERYGHTMDEIGSGKGAALACEYCRGIRRHLLDRLARDHGITKLAVGTSLDDGAQETLKAFFCGNVEQMILSCLPITSGIPVIQPFMDVPATETRLYAALHTGAPAPATCPYAAAGIDSDVHTVLDEFTVNHPGTKHALVNLRENLSRAGCTAAEAFSTCPRCGEPGTVSGECRHCSMIDGFVRGSAR